jgi:hypothetical protein
VAIWVGAQYDSQVPNPSQYFMQRRLINHRTDEERDAVVLQRDAQLLKPVSHWQPRWPLIRI